jgi:hypothetical protein
LLDLSNISGNKNLATQLLPTAELTKAKVAAKELEVALSSAMNVNTGRLNLTTFISSLNRAGKTLGDY